MTSAVRWLVTVLAGDVASTPRLCDGCGRTWRRLTPGQAAQVGSKRLPTCRRFRCTGRLWPVWPEATDRLIADLRTNGAPGSHPGTPPHPTAEKEPKDMETVPKEAQRLQPGDVITQHPDHPDDPAWAVWYRVSTWPHRIEIRPDEASVLIDYTCRPEQVDGETCGVLMLDLDQPCTVVPAHAHGGAQ